MKTAILFINGEIDLNFCEAYYLAYYSGLPIYCADGAYNKIKPSLNFLLHLKLIIGDGDSLKDADEKGLPYKLLVDQNYTDFEKSIDYLLTKGYEKICVFGFGGGEMDHYLGNISCVLAFKEQVLFEFVDKFAVSQLMKTENLLTGVKHKMISIVPLFELIGINIQGCAFDLENESLVFGQRTSTRNHAIKDKVEVTHNTGDGLIFVSHEYYHQSK